MEEQDTPKPKRTRKRKVETTIKRFPVYDAVDDVETSSEESKKSNWHMFAIPLGIGVLVGGVFFAALKLDKHRDPVPVTPPKIEAKKEPTKPVVVETAPAKLLDSKKYAIVIRNPDGSVSRKYGGSVGWRQNNPGVLAYGNHSKANGALDQQNNASIFPDYESGYRALYTYLFETDMKNSSLSFFVRRLYPKDIQTVFAAALSATGASADTKLEALTEAQRKALCEAIQKALGWREGSGKTFATETDWRASE